MSTRATVYIHWSDGEMDIKLYHHFDGYVSYLGENLDKALRKWSKPSNKKNLLERILEIWGFEQARPLHMDAEYVYHVTWDIWNHRDEKKDTRIWDHRWKLECQSGFDEEEILKHDKVLLSQNRHGNKKKLDYKQAELDLGNREKFVEWYFNS